MFFFFFFFLIVLKKAFWKKTAILKQSLKGRVGSGEFKSFAKQTIFLKFCKNTAKYILNLLTGLQSCFV